MRLVCDGCSARYSVGDDRIAGKVFKIRCRRCGTVIIARGTAPAMPASASASGEWHAVVAGTQHGPCELAELVRMAVPDEALVWREGWTDWRTARDVDELRRTPAAAPALTAERNESSVLFTLGNLAKLATPPQPTTTPTSTPGEGSGLIDIRSLARSLAPPASAPAPKSSEDEPPSFVPTGFAEPAVLLPVARGATHDRRLVMALVAALGLVVLLAGVLAVVLVRGRTADARAATVVAPASAPAPPAPAPLPAPVAQPAAPAAPPPPPPAAVPAPRVAAPPRGRVAPRPSPPPPPAPSESGSCTQVSCIVSGYAEPCCAAFRANAGTLDRAQLAAGIATIDVRGCSGHGAVKLSLAVAPAGSVTSVTIRSSTDDALASCVVAAARKGTFAKTQRGGAFSYTWRL